MKNKVFATGKLIKLYINSDETLKLRLFITRSGHKDVYMNFIYDGVLGKGINVGDVISIEGYIDGYNYIRDDGRLIERQFFKAKTVCLAEGDMKKIYNLQDHFPPEHEFKAFIEGTIDSIDKRADDDKRIYLKIDEGERGPYRVIMGVFRHPMIEDDFNSLSVGNKLACYLDIQTVQKTIDGVDRSFEYLMIEDFHSHS